MDRSVRALSEALKKIIWQLKPQQNPLSFVLITGKANQGKTALLRQSSLENISINAEKSATIYYNQQGIMLELGESWINESDNLLQHTLKQLNHCHRHVKISGIMLCIDIQELLTQDQVHFAELCKNHMQLLARFGTSLGYRIDTAIVFTKVDYVAGFCEFFQSEHASELTKPLGFSLHGPKQTAKLIETFNIHFEHLIEFLGQHVISKMHPARSSIKRTLIRELPLQLASLRSAIQMVLQHISPRYFRVQALYFTSAEQGGISVDRLNKKIQQEYALTIQDRFPQSNNYRSYFITGALHAFQHQTLRSTPRKLVSHQWGTAALVSILGFSILWLVYQHVKSIHLLDEASKELLAYETLAGQKDNSATALYHLSKASTQLQKIPTRVLSMATLQQLKEEIQRSTKTHLHGNFLPGVLGALEQTMNDPNQSQLARYSALKIYLMLGDAQHFSAPEVISWFQNYLQQNPKQHAIGKQLALLKEALRRPGNKVIINTQVVSDVRNYLNALPAGYLYYTLAKSKFPQDKENVHVDGFDLPVTQIPYCFTKPGFEVVTQLLPSIAKSLQEENWVLARQDLQELPLLLQQAYCFEYESWWQQVIKKSLPTHFQDYQSAQRVITTLHQSNAFSKLLGLIQDNTRAEIRENYTLFNQEIASKFTSFNLISPTHVNQIALAIQELESYLTTLSVVHDEGKTAFNLLKSHFQGKNGLDPLSMLASRTHELTEPISSWTKQLVDNTLFILIHDSKTYLNKQWREVVLNDYNNHIAHRYPFDLVQTQEVATNDFDRFFSAQGILNTFVEENLKPFLDTSKPQWELKALHGYVMPISTNLINELIRANVITNMFFPHLRDTSQIEFSLQKISLDPVISSLELALGPTVLSDTQASDSFTRFNWPLAGAKLTLVSIEGNHYELSEQGPWAFFKMLQKVNVLVDERDSSNLEILFEINGNSGRYLLKTQNQINPFIPGILNGFTLMDTVVG